VLDRAKRIVEVVDERDPSRDVERGHVVVCQVVEVLDECP
jgi:hypothetical protein